MKSGTFAGDISLELGTSESSPVGHDVTEDSDAASVELVSVVASK